MPILQMKQMRLRELRTCSKGGKQSHSVCSTTSCRSLQSLWGPTPAPANPILLHRKVFPAPSGSHGPCRLRPGPLDTQGWGTDPRDTWGPGVLPAAPVVLSGPQRQHPPGSGSGVWTGGGPGSRVRQKVGGALGSKREAD